MKKLNKLGILLLWICLIAGFTFAKKASGTASIKFTETVWDFGTIKKDKPASHDFEYTNVGTGNLIITDASAQCGCTRPEYSDKPVAPGKKGKVKVTYNPVGRPGSFEKTVTVKTNGNPKKARVKIRGTVAP